MNEEKRQHLEFIQNVITRMNTNSFQLKGMAVTIVSALIAIYATTTNILFIFIAIVPTILFWFLDTYYLQQERKFRGVYNNVTELKNDVEIRLYEMPIKKFQGGQYCFCSVFFSKTIAWLYGTIITLLFISGLILKFKNCIITFNYN
ncbi:MAG: hypothetical protein ACRC4W_04980 [Treponemataceae bacterium]